MQAIQTIESGSAFPDRQDGTMVSNRERRLPWLVTAPIASIH